MLSVCDEAGLHADDVLADDHISPCNIDDCFALATDDIMFFIARGLAHAQSRACALDKALAAAGVLRNTDKDITGSLSATCIGVDVCDGRFLAPNAPKPLSFLFFLGHASVV